MRRGQPAFLLLVVFLASATAPVTAQSLGQIARETKQQAKAVKKAVRLYTNDNLPPPAPWEDRAPSTPPAQSAETQAEETSPAAKAEIEEGAPNRTKEYWQEKFTAVRRELAGAQSEQRLAQDEMSLLQIQQAREIDPGIQTQVKAKIGAKQTELAGIQLRIDKIQKLLDDLQSEFDASGAPAEWSQTANSSPESQSPSP